ncbi:MAG: DUF1015 domain-containing protein [Firmicutes bacterium]|nr:DUF1015 domain-containing protein [Bacillota bacterium]
MAKIVPIRGVRYSTAKAGQMADLITPPYDVINDEEQKRYYEKNPFNVIRLEYGESREPDSKDDNRYTRAAGFFSHWLQQEILTHEDKPSIYLYQQEFTVAGRRMTRSGFITGVGVEEYENGMILPHEETLSKAKLDRLELLRHCHANFSPIFGLYDDATQTVEAISARYIAHDPTIAFTSENGEEHRLWSVNDDHDVATITKLFSQQKIYIADGHHRYETALTFHKEMSAQGDHRFAFCLMTLVNLSDPGLVIFPTHRLLKNIHNFHGDDFLANLSQDFTIKTFDLPKANRAEALTAELKKLASLMQKQNAFLLYLGGEQIYRLTISNERENRLMANRHGNYSAAWRSLDVAVLQSLILEELLGIDKEARASGTHLTYTRDEAKALEQVERGEYQAVFFLNPTQVHEVTAVAAAGDKMPQKSTFFYPKLITGLVINDFSV